MENISDLGWLAIMIVGVSWALAFTIWASYKYGNKK